MAHSPIKFGKLLKRSIWPKDETQTGTTTWNQKAHLAGAVEYTKDIIAEG